MASNSSRAACPEQPPSLYRDLRLPDGSHSGVRIDARRLILEVQRRGVKHYFDLTEIIDFGEQVCYDSDEQFTAPTPQPTTEPAA